MADITRRNLLHRGFRPKGGAEPLRPPWSTETSIADSCTACGSCIRACPERIISTEGGRPYISIGLGECSFCRKCANACPEDVFDMTREPFEVHASITGACLLKTGIDCRLCTDSCEPRALKFDLHIRPVGAITVLTDLCNGCGACAVACPATAIAFIRPDERPLPHA